MQSHTILTTLVVVLNPEHTKMLLVKRNKESWKGYAPPGGHVDFPESLMQGAIREVREETGLTVSALKLTGISHFVGLDNGENYLVFNYITDRSQGELRPGEGEDPVEWVDLDQLEELPLAEGLLPRLKDTLAGRCREYYYPWGERCTLPTEVIPM